MAGEQRQALRERIDRATARVRGLPAAEQRRRFEQSLAQRPTLFALLSRFQADPALRQLVRDAVERTRMAPPDAELARAVTRSLNSAFRGGHRTFRQALCFALDRVREEFGADNAKRVTLAELQRRYLALSARSREARFDAPRAVMAVATVAEVWNCAAEAAGDDAVAVATPAAASALPGDAAGHAAAVEDELLATGMAAACLHIEAGARNFPEFAAAMALDLGDAVRPYLRVFYEAIRHYPGLDFSGMKPAPEVAGGFGF